MIRRAIGRQGRTVNAIGLGCMGMSAFYGEPMSDQEAVALLHAALERGVDHFDTAEAYGSGANERLLGLAFADRRDRVFIATKFGFRIDPATNQLNGTDGSPANGRRAVEQSLRLLKTDHIDLLYLHRKDPAIEIEEIVGGMAKLVEEGKVRELGLSEVSDDTLRRAHRTHPIAALQSEYSIFSRDVEASILPACRKLGVSFVAYSPLGRGLLTGKFGKEWLAHADAKDFRTSTQPRFQGDAYEANLALVQQVEALAAAKRATAGQVALAWVLAQGNDVHVIPGTTKLRNLEANLGAADVTLTAGERAQLEALAAHVQGARYPPARMAMIQQ
jgi:aryl-alcohol dehydrogenase-like predicted oxidoreductase